MTYAINFAAPAVAYTDADLDRLARTLLGEAANQGPEGQAAVGWVVRNRMADPRWPGGVGGVAIPGQFSAWNTDGTGNNFVNTGPLRRDYADAMAVARAVLDGTIEDPTGGATHYYSPSGMDAYVDAGHQSNRLPTWYGEEAARGAPRTIGDHVFLGSVFGGPPASPAPAAEAPVAQQANSYSLSGGLSAPPQSVGLSGGLSAPQQPQDGRSGIRRLYDWMGDDGLLSGLVTGAGLIIGGDRALPMLDPYAGAYGDTEQRRRMQQALAMLPQLDPQTAALVQAAVAAGQPDAAFKMAAAALQKTGEPFTLGEGEVRFDSQGRPVARGPAKAASASDSYSIQKAEDGTLWYVAKDGTGASPVANGPPPKAATPTGEDAERARKARIDAAERVVRRMEALPANATPEQRQAAYTRARTVVSNFADVTGVPEAYSPEGYAAMSAMFSDAKGGGTPTEGERKAGAALTQAREAFTSLQRLLTPEDQGGKGFTGPSAADDFYQGASEMFFLPDWIAQAQNNDTLEYRNAIETLSQMMLRVESGATITNPEIASKMSQLRITSLDPPPVVAFKLKQLDAVMRALEAAAGRALPEGYEPARGVSAGRASDMSDEELLDGIGAQ